MVRLKFWARLAAYGVWTVFAIVAYIIAANANQQESGAAGIIAWAIMVLGVIVAVIFYFLLVSGKAGKMLGEKKKK